MSSTRQEYTSLAAQKEKALVSDLKRAKEDLKARKADAEAAGGRAGDRAEDRIHEARPRRW